MLTATALKTSLFKEREDLETFLALHLTGQLQNGDVIAITSKIVSLAEGRLVPKSRISKKDLIVRESEIYLGEGGFGSHLTIAQGLLIPSAGIDESNSESGDYILYPLDPYASAQKIHRFLCQTFSLNRLGVLLTDSHSSPLRRGVTGISLAHWGIRGTRSLVGAPDLFGQPLKFTHVNVVDSLAAMAVFVMGEANDRSPLALLRGADLEFTGSTNPDEIRIRREEDIYYPLLKSWGSRD